MLETLQRYLTQPAPELLEPAAGAEILVTTAEATGTGGGAREDPAEVAVGYLLWLPGDPVYVAELVVAPAFRRAGRASALVTTLLGDLAPGTRVRLQVAESNDAARELYRSLGFAVVGHDPNAYEAGPGLWMETVVE